MQRDNLKQQIVSSEDYFVQVLNYISTNGYTVGKGNKGNKCPHHSINTNGSDSFTWKQTTDGTWIGGCWSCGLKGNIIDIYAKVYGINTKDKQQFNQLLEDIASICGINYTDNTVPVPTPTLPYKNNSTPKVKERSKDEVQTILNTIEQAHNNVADTDYFYKRGFTDDTINEYKLGYIPNCICGGFDNGPGAIVPYPGEDYYFTRLLAPKGKLQKIFLKDVPLPIFNSGCIKDNNIIWVTEGQFDCLSILQLGFNCIGTNSTTGNNKLVDYIKSNNITNKVFIVAYDNDDPGNKGADELISLLNKEGLHAIRYTPTQYKDINDMLVNCKEQLLQDIIQVEEQAQQLLLIPITKLYGPYKFNINKNNLIYLMEKVDKEGNLDTVPVPIYEGNLIFEQKVVYIKDDTNMIELTSTSNGYPVTKVFSYEDIFTEAKKLKVAFATTNGFHIYVGKNTPYQLQQYLQVQEIALKREGKLQTKLVTSDIGQITYKNKDYIVYPNYNTTIDGNIYYMDNSNSVAKCFSTKGTTEDWINNCLQGVLDNNNAKGCILGGFGSQLIKLLDIHENFVIELVGNTGTGKSTVLNLVSSIYGRPRDYLQEWLSTGNAIMNTVSSFNTYPCIYNDTTTAKLSNKELQETVYAISMGESKKRVNKSGKTKETKEFRNIFFTSCETSLMESFKTGQGAFARIVSLRGAFEKNEDNRSLTETIQRNTKKYYGTIGLEWTKYLVQLKNDTDKIEQLQDLYSTQCQILANKVTNLIAKRVTNHLALLYITGYLLEDFLGVDYFGYETLINKLAKDIDGVADDNDLIQNAYMYVVDYLLNKKTGDSFIGTIYDPIGFIKENLKINNVNVGDCLCVNLVKLNNILKEGEYNVADIKNSFKEQGYIIPGKKLTRVVKDKQGNSKNCVVIPLRPYYSIIGTEEDYVPVDNIPNPSNTIDLQQRRLNKRTSDNTVLVDDEF